MKLLEYERFANPENFVRILAPSLKQICFFIRYYFQIPVVDVISLTTAWSVAIPIDCLLDKTNKCVLMFTASRGLHFLNLPASVGKQIVLGSKYTQRVTNLCINDSSTLTDTFLTLQHFHCLQKFRINVNGRENTCKYFRCVQSEILHIIEYNIQH